VILAMVMTFFCVVIHLSALFRSCFKIASCIQWPRCPAKLDDPSIIISKVGLDSVENVLLIRLRRTPLLNRIDGLEAYLNQLRLGMSSRFAGPLNAIDNLETASSYCIKRKIVG
jgi:hypothetical protein